MLPLLCKVAPQTTDLYRCAHRALPFYELGCALFVLPPAPPTAGLQRSAHHAIPFYVLGREPSILPLLCKVAPLQPAQQQVMHRHDGTNPGDQFTEPSAHVSVHHVTHPIRKRLAKPQRAPAIFCEAKQSEVIWAEIIF
jgi:hypothetical protein